MVLTFAQLSEHSQIIEVGGKFTCIMNLNKKKIDNVFCAFLFFLFFVFIQLCNSVISCQVWQSPLSLPFQEILLSLT